ncbi:MAG: hypothetical protein E6G97_20025 [Alphaproteobacteria bacterium]|nr:MAG: hypothetical protein E6G97_20025 [Alphaproteobacteria bacterium]
MPTVELSPISSAIKRARGMLVPAVKSVAVLIKKSRGFRNHCLFGACQTVPMRMVFVMLTVLAFTLWDQSGNHGQYTGTFFSVLRRALS